MVESQAPSTITVNLTRERFRRAWKGFTRGRGPVIGLVLVGIVVLMALFGEWLAPFPEDAQGEVNFAARLLPPSSGHLLGTDAAGCDILSRVLIGARISISVAIAVVALALLIGVPLGAIAGFAGGLLDTLIMRVTDLFLAFPALVLALAILGIMGTGLNNAVIAMAAVWWPGYVRLVRAQVLAVKQEDFVEAARCIGASRTRVIVKHILPNMMSPVLVKASMDIGSVILLAAGLGFIGLGPAPPTPEWGTMVSEGRRYMPDHWWYSVFPGAAIFLTALGFSLLADGIRDALDPASAMR